MSSSERRIEGDPAGAHTAAKPVAFPDLLPEIRHFCRTMAVRKGLDFAIAIDADVPPAIVIDRLRLQELLKNLLAKAFVFTRKGGVALRIRRARGGAPDATVIAFDIVDTGFEHDYASTLPGAHAAALLGGRLAWSGTSDFGNTFSVYLPLIARPL